MMLHGLRGVIDKIVREIWIMIAITSLAVLIFAMLFSFVLPQFREGLSDFILEVPFLRALISSSMGIDVSGGLTVSMILSVVWTHPIMLTTTWAIAIVLGTRYPAGEIDRGTIEVLLGWPVSRRTVSIAETLGWVAAGAMLIACIFTGYAIGLTGLDAGDRPPLGPVVFVAINMMCLYATVGGLAALVSSLSERRGRAFGVVFGILIVSYLINFLAGIWEPAKSLAFLSIMNYYKPADTIRMQSMPWGDAAVLATLAAVMWTAGLEITARRSIATT